MQHFSKSVRIKNHAGIHCRPSAAIMQLVNSLKPTVFTLKTSSQTIQLNSLLALIACGLREGELVEITASGENAKIAVEQVTDLFESEFDFPSQN